MLTPATPASRRFIRCSPTPRYDTPSMPTPSPGSSRSPPHESSATSSPGLATPRSPALLGRDPDTATGRRDRAVCPRDRDRTARQRTDRAHHRRHPHRNRRPRPLRRQGNASGTPHRARPDHRHGDEPPGSPNAPPSTTPDPLFATEIDRKTSSARDLIDRSFRITTTRAAPILAVLRAEHHRSPPCAAPQRCDCCTPALMRPSSRSGPGRPRTSPRPSIYIHAEHDHQAHASDPRRPPPSHPPASTLVKNLLRRRAHDIPRPTLIMPTTEARPPPLTWATGTPSA